MFSLIFFFNDTATTEIYTLSLHDALPISLDRALGLLGARPRLPHRGQPDRPQRPDRPRPVAAKGLPLRGRRQRRDRKSTRLNSSHANISYAVFCLKKKSALLLATAGSRRR